MPRIHVLRQHRLYGSNSQDSIRPAHLVSPFQDGFLLEYVFVIEGLEDVRHLGQQWWVDLPNKFLKPDQQVFLGLLVVNNKLCTNRTEDTNNFWQVMMT